MSSSTMSEITAAGGQAVVSADPVGTAEAAEAMVGLCVDRFGRIDGLVNNAGIHYVKPVWEETARDVERVMQVNLLGSIHCAASAIRRMRDRGSGAASTSGPDRCAATGPAWGLMVRPRRRSRR
jgi:NAD(P)-dependent dehydrogenase (short-subunit alcohol dehydrogenase family)